MAVSRVWPAEGSRFSKTCFGTIGDSEAESAEIRNGAGFERTTTAVSGPGVSTAMTFW